jgi:hypothetical protein
VAIAALATVALRGTRHPFAAAVFAAVAAGVNLWSGRVPFLLGSAFAVGALLALRKRHRTGTVALTALSILASPVSGAFLVIGLSGTFLTTRTKEYRPIVGWAIGTCVVALAGVAVMFGTPGPEPFSSDLFVQLVPAGLLLAIAAGAPDHVRTTAWLSLLATVVLFAVPNGMGANYQRFVWFCLPVLVLALSRWRASLAVLTVLPVLIVGTIPTVKDLRNAEQPVSSVSYYRSLAARLDTIPDLQDYRVEVVNHGAHAGYDALLEHAMLARGWETQEDTALNKSLSSSTLDSVTYKVWLDNNAVGYVALPAESVAAYPEYTLVQSGKLPYLHRVWSNADWQLFQVRDATPIVGRPGSVLGHDQKSLTISVPCACTMPVRVRWSKFLTAALQVRGPRGTPVDARPAVRAQLKDDGTGWTRLTTARAGMYVLRGSLRGGLPG